MSKQSEAKMKQGYVAKAVPRICSTCKQFTFDHVQMAPPSIYRKEGWWVDKNLRCSIGGFAVKKTGTCDLYEQSEVMNGKAILS